MKNKKWYWVDTTNKSCDQENESGIIPMPELPKTRESWRFKHTIPNEDDDNSLMKRVGRQEKYAVESIVDWDNTCSKQSYVQHYQRWEGRVVEIYQDTFLARLTDSKGQRMPRVAKIKKTLINKNDWEVFFHEGFEFEWVFKEVITNGTFSRKNEIRFTPVTRYMPDEIEEFVKKSMNEFSYMLKEDD